MSSESLQLASPMECIQLLNLEKLIKLDNHHPRDWNINRQEGVPRGSHNVRHRPNSQSSSYRIQIT